VPALPTSVLEPLWVQVAELLPTRQVHHPLGLPPAPHPRPHRVRQAHQILVFGCGYRRIADTTCSATTLRRRRDEWISAGVAEQLRRGVLAAYDRMLGLDLEQLAVDGCTTKAPCDGQVGGPSPVDRRKQGLKRSVAVEAGGIPLAAVPAPANRRDDGLLAATLDAIGAVGPLPAQPVVHLDAGYNYQPCRQILTMRGMVGEIATRGVPARSTLAAGGGQARPCLGQPGRQAVLVHRAATAGGRVLAGVGQRRHHLWPTGPLRLDPLPLAGSPTSTPMTTS
jgi:transposase